MTNQRTANENVRPVPIQATFYNAKTCHFTTHLGLQPYKLVEMAETLDLNSLSEVLNLPFPAQTKQVAGKVNGVLTDVLSMGFSDRILVTVSQEGRLAHWVSFVDLCS